jgi:hypothetical protein
MVGFNLLKQSRDEWVLTMSTDSELSSLILSVRRVGTVIERAYGADGLTIACQVFRSWAPTLFEFIEYHMK